MIIKIKKFFYIPVILYLISFNINTGQEIDTVNVTEDSLKTFLHINPYVEEGRLFLGQESFDIPLPLSMFQSPDLHQDGDESRSLTGLKLQMNDYIRKRAGEIPSYDMGEFSKYLGYAQGVAVIILAIMHLAEYGLK